MKKLRTAVLAAALTALCGGLALSSSSTAGAGNDLKADLVDVNGAALGYARLSFESGGSTVRVTVQMDPSMAGFHGFHIHSVGQCVAPFTTAGAHLGENAADVGHRHRNHDGDLPLLLVNRDGTGQALFATDRLDLGEILDADGSAFIIHAGPDNYANVPERYSNANAVVPPVYAGTSTDDDTLKSGDAGARVACGVIG